MKPRTTICEGWLSRRSGRGFAAVVGVGIGLGGAPLLAQMPDLVTDRPDQTESTAIVPRGYVQVETGWTFARATEAGFRSDLHTVASSLVRIGTVSRMEARIGFAGWQRVNQTGLPPVAGAGDLDVGIKYQLLPGNGRNTEIALLTSIVLPTGATAFRSSRIETAVRLAVSHSFGERVGLGYNVATTVASQRSGPRGIVFEELAYTVSLGLKATHRVGLFVESFGSFSTSALTRSEHSLDGGLTVALLRLLQLDVSGGFGLNPAAADWFIGAGLSVLVGG